MIEVTQLHNPKWRPVDAEWHMLIGNRSVAVLMPNRASAVPWVNWLSRIDADYEDHGWSAVDFATLADGQRDLEQWWFHLCRGEKYRPDTGQARHSRWSGNPRGDAAGQAPGQSH